MRFRLIAFLLAALILLVGCAPTPGPEPVQELDLGTTPENLTNGRGYFAQKNGLIYTSVWGDSSILEFDPESGTAVELMLPMGDSFSFTSKSMRNLYSCAGNVFMLQNHVAFIERSNLVEMYVDESGKTQQLLKKLQTLSCLNLENGISTPISELGEYVYKVIPVKKTKADTDETLSENVDSPSDKNPLAGLDLYFYFGYDTFPEKAAQMAQDGISIEEPVEEEERNKYIVPSLGYMDGDTRRVRILTQDFNGVFFVDDHDIYIMKTTEQGEQFLYRSSRDIIKFEQIDTGGPVGNYIACYDGGFYFFRAGSWQVFWYKDGIISELPIISCRFMQYGDKLIYHDNHWERDTDIDPVKIKSYDLKTGEEKVLIEGVHSNFNIVGEKYLCCLMPTDSNVDRRIIIDLDTGEQVEIPVPST